MERRVFFLWVGVGLTQFLVSGDDAVEVVHLVGIQTGSPCKQRL
jgi:hypothetical protein